MNISQIHYIFFGTSEFAVPALQTLAMRGFVPRAIVTTPDRPAGRKLQTTASPIKKYVLNAPKLEKIPLLQPDRIDNVFVEQIKIMEADAGVVVSYGKILPKALIEAFPRGILNIHPSLLPKYRGPSPLENTILNGDTKTGVTIMAIDDTVDHGPILTQKDIAISEQITYQELHDMLAHVGAQLIADILPLWIDEQINTIPQDDTHATFTKLLKKEDGKIDWRRSSQEIDRQVRALNPWPGTYTILVGRKILKIKKTEQIDTPTTLQAGIIFEKDGYPAVVCGKGALKLLVVHPENKQEISGKEFLHGHPQIVEGSV